MNLYLIWQDDNDGWEAYEGAVVAAESEKDARSIHPAPGSRSADTWVKPDLVGVRLLAGDVIVERGVILARERVVRLASC